VWHWGATAQEGSEHHLEGVQHPAELQLFHWNTKYSSYEEAVGQPDGLAAVSFFYQLSSTDNSNLSTLMSAVEDLDMTIGTEGLYMEQAVTGLSLTQLLPEGGVLDSDNFYYYSGSLTQPGNATFGGSPDCTEPVLWINYERTIPISGSQLRTLRAFLITVSTAHSLSSLDRHICVTNFRPIHAFSPSSRAIARKLPLESTFKYTKFPGQAPPTEQQISYRQFGYVSPMAAVVEVAMATARDTAAVAGAFLGG
jgi:hypothetical protein